MKGWLYIMIGMLSLLLACSDATTGGEVSTSARIVQLQTGIVPRTRSALTTFNGDTVAFAYAETSGHYAEEWRAVAGTSGTNLLGQYFYPDDRSYIYLRGYYPFQSLTGGNVSYRLDGQTDLMATVEQRGNLTDNFSLASKIFYFNHLLTQLNLEVRLNKEEEKQPIRLAKMQVSGSRQEVTVRLADARSDTLPRLSFSGNAAPLTAYVEPSRYNGLPLSAEAVSLPTLLLVEPGAALSLDIKLAFSETETIEYTALPVRFDEPGGISRPGTAYRITVTLAPSLPEGEAVSVGASVVPWKEGRGNGIIE